MCGLTITTGAADFLGIVFKRFGKVVMVDGSDVGFVDSHTKCDGGTDDGDFSGHKLVLNFGACFWS